MLEFIQSRLLDVGSVVATPRSSSSEKLSKVSFDPNHVTSLESWIDHLDSSLPPLKNFILPSGGEAAARLHVARSVCRRAERSLVKQYEAGDIDEHTYKFMNRLSDFLFIAARTVAHRENHLEVIWKKD
jgi:cob(I)alamin adenosyltransferase